jgi:hypothetical protein
MSELHLIEDHGTWRELSDGSIIVLGHRDWDKYGGPGPAAPKPPEGPRKILQSEFNEMDHAQRWEAIRAGAQVVDSLAPPKKPAPPPPRGPEITRASWGKMSDQEKWRAWREGARIVD